MDTEKLTQHVIDHGKLLAKHDSDIKTLYQQQRNIEKLTESTHSLALSVEKLTGRVSDVNKRLDSVESEKRQKGFAIWQIVVSAVLGGALTYLVAVVLG